jgi:hypothetical protein
MFGARGATSQSSTWEFLCIWSFMAAHVAAGQWIVMATPLRVYYSASKEEFLMVLAGWLPWRPRHLPVREGHLLAAPSNRPSEITQHLDPWRHRLLPGGRWLVINGAHFKSDWFYRKITGTHFEQEDDAGRGRGRDY